MGASWSAQLCVVNYRELRSTTQLQRCSATKPLVNALVRTCCAKQLTETHNYAQYVRMAAIDHKGLTKAMDLALVTPKQLAEATGMSLTYVCDITAGRRTLKRNPELRKKIAVALNVPQHWIEHAEPVAS